MQFPVAIVTALPNACLLAWGWRRKGFAFLAGSMAALALPPYGAVPVLAISFPVLVWLMDGAVAPGDWNALRRFRTGATLGWFFGFGYFLAGLWWIGAAFLVDADRFAWLLPLAVLGMPAGLAIFTAIAVGLSAILWNGTFLRIGLLAASLALSDWLRGNVLTGFPWNAFGYSISESLVLAQTASVTGVYGLSFLAVLIFASPAVLADARPIRHRFFLLLGAAVLLAGMVVFGTVRLTAPISNETGMTVRIVQPSIAQQDKWRPELKDEIFDTLLEMSGVPSQVETPGNSNRLVVWPESAVPFLLTREPGALVRIAEVLQPNDMLATGAIRVEQESDRTRYFNSVYVVDTHGAVRDVYDKVRLVPFGEFIPFEGVFRALGIENLAGTPEGFDAGYRSKLLSGPGAALFLPLICYEAIFPGAERGMDQRPDFILNLTNDAWFGRTPGPFQHMSQARLRAIESGVPLVRAANTGVSAVVDGHGRLLQSLTIFDSGVIDVTLPESIGKTYYGKFDDGLFLWSMLLIFLASVAVIIKSRTAHFNRFCCWDGD